MTAKNHSVDVAGCKHMSNQEAAH